MQIIQQFEKSQPFILMPRRNRVQGMRIVVIRVVEIDGKGFPTATEGITDPAIGRGRNRAALANLCRVHHIGFEQCIHFPGRSDTLCVGRSLQYLPVLQLPERGFFGLFASSHEPVKQEGMVF